MENSQNTALALQNPAHDPLLSYFSALINRNEPETAVSVQISNTSAEGEHITGFGSLNVTENHNNQDEHITGGLALNTRSGIMNNSIEENRNLPNIVRLDHSITIGNEGEGGGATGDDPNIIEISDQQTTKLDASIVDPYALTMVLSLLVFVFIKLQQGIHNPLNIAKPFMILIVVGLGIAYATYCILYWIKDRPDYKMLKGLYYIACNLVFITLLVVVFTTT